MISVGIGVVGKGQVHSISLAINSPKVVLSQDFLRTASGTFRCEEEAMNMRFGAMLICSFYCLIKC